MGHVNSILMAVSKCPNPTVFQKTLAVNDFYFGSSEFEHPMGHISFVGKLDGVTLDISSAGSTQHTWASDLALRRHEKPSHVAQRMHLLWRGFRSSRMTPSGTWKGCRPSPSRSSARLWMRGSWGRAG